MADVTVKLSFGELMKTLAALGEKVPQAIAVAVRVSIEAMIRDVVRNRMNDRTRYIGVVTGTGRRSVMGSGTVRVDGDRVIGSFGSPLIYIRAHELGFTGRVAVRGHVRRITAPSFRSGRMTTTSARELKAALRTGGRTTAFVRAHSRLMNIRAKHFFADTLAAGAPGVTKRSVAALLHLAKTGNVPSVTNIPSVG